jgi:1-acyl-sn-glycerol-3-phosphate acyltransferase
MIKNHILRYTIIFIIIIILKIYLVKKINPPVFIDYLLNVFNVKINIKGKENLKLINDRRVIIMSNHINPLDYCVIYSVFNKFTTKKFFAIVKHNLFGDPYDKSKFSNLVSLYKNKLHKYLNFISYVKNNKESGNLVKKKIIEVVNDNNTVILFPEGTVTRLGLSEKFKPGSFKICAENQISILPVTIRYNKRIGMNISDGFNVKSIFNSNATIEIHKPIYDLNYEILQNKVYETIVNPLKSTYKNLNIIN